jgi:hypothetical protein
MQVFCSYIITNNYAKNNYLEPDDRRFSVIDINQEKLLKKMSSDQIDEWIKEMHLEENIWNFGHFLLQRKPKYSVHEFYRGPRFDELVRVSQAEWQKFLIKIIKSRKQHKYSLLTLRELYEKSTGGKFSAQSDAIEDFLKNNNLVGDEPIATLSEDEENTMLLYLIPNEKYKPDTVNPELSQELS